MKVKTRIVLTSIFVIISVMLIGIIAINFEYSLGVIKSTIISASTDNTPGEAPEGTYPVILLHGLHLTYNQRFSEFTFKEMQDNLAKDSNYKNRGILNPETSCAELRYSKNPIVIRTTYLNQLGFDEIDTYSQNLKEIIEKVKTCTGAEKVDIVTHSMGGIVARYYLQNSENPPVRKLIMLGTPNHGGLYNIAEVADYLTDDDGNSILNLDFVQLSENNEFMQTLNENPQNIGEIEFYTVAGDVEGKGDGIVEKQSVKLDYSTHRIVPCNHIELKDPSRCPEAYEHVKKALKSEI